MSDVPFARPATAKPIIACPTCVDGSSRKLEYRLQAGVKLGPPGIRELADHLGDAGSVSEATSLTLPARTRQTSSPARCHTAPRPQIVPICGALRQHLQPGPHFTSLDASLRGYTTRYHLGVLLHEQGRAVEAEALWRAAVAEQPGFVPAWEQLAGQGQEVFLLNAGGAAGLSRGLPCLPLNAAAFKRLPALDAFIVQNCAGHGRALRAALGPQTRLIFWSQHAHDQPAVQPLREAAERRAYNALVLVSAWQREQYRKHFGLDPERMVVLRNGIGPAFRQLFGEMLLLPSLALRACVRGR